MALFHKKLSVPSPEDALPGRSQRMPVPERHFVNGNPIASPFRDGLELALFGMGCFWGAERMYWQAEGVYSTAVGYAAGHTPNPTYEEVCSGFTGHNEVVLAVFDPTATSYVEMLRIFWEGHDPTAGMRQGNDVGTQYRSGVYTHSNAQREVALASRDVFQKQLSEVGSDTITSEILDAPELYYAEEYHQQYLAKNPNGYCGLGGTGVRLPAGFSEAP